MLPIAKKSKIAIFDKGLGQVYMVVDLGVIWKGFISRVCMPNMESISSGSRVIAKFVFFFLQNFTDRVIKSQADDISGHNKNLLTEKEMCLWHTCVSRWQQSPK